LQGQASLPSPPIRATGAIPGTSLSEIYLHGYGINPLAAQISPEPFLIEPDLGGSKNKCIAGAHDQFLIVIAEF
jgi:hypothetical protein